MISVSSGVRTDLIFRDRKRVWEYETKKKEVLENKGTVCFSTRLKMVESTDEDGGGTMSETHWSGYL